MSSNTISGASFSITPLNESAYVFNIAFANKTGETSTKKFTFIQGKNVKEGTTFDVFTKNAKSDDISTWKNTFQKRDLSEIKNAVKQLKPVECPGSLAAVFDFKEPHTQYIPCSELKCSYGITEAEKAVCDFLKEAQASPNASKQAKTAQQLFKTDLPLDFIICEGSLKMKLLQNGGFTDEQIEYLNAPKGQGALSFCQCAEYFMTGFKLGQYAQNENGTAEFLANQYIQTVSHKFDTFVPHTKSTVFYPLLYKDIYSIEGAFAKSLEPVFSVSGDFTASNKITSLHVENKQ